MKTKNIKLFIDNGVGDLFHEGYWIYNRKSNYWIYFNSGVPHYSPVEAITGALFISKPEIIF